MLITASYLSLLLSVKVIHFAGVTFSQVSTDIPQQVADLISLYQVTKQL